MLNPSAVARPGHLPPLHASSRGVNKDVQFPSNEYWDPALRPKLMIWYE